MNRNGRRSTGLARRLTIATAFAVAACALSASPALAVWGFESWDASLDGPQADVAGGHADFTTEFVLNNDPDPGGTASPNPHGDLKELSVDLPPGLIADPSATPKCSSFDFFDLTPGTLNLDEGCEASTQVGVVTITLTERRPDHVPATVPLFNMERRHANELARLAFFVPGVGVTGNVVARVRTDSDFGVTATMEGVTRAAAPVSAEVTLWAEPGHEDNDPLRYPQLIADGRVICGAVCTGVDEFEFQPGIFVPSPFADALNPNPGLPARPFLSNPTTCGTPLTATVTGEAYQEPGNPASATAALDPDGLTGCEAMPFDPSLSVAPRSRLVDSPSGFDVDVTLPPTLDPNVPAQSHMRRAVVTLPEGVSINPSAAHGLVACTDAQLRIGTRERANCPDASRVGSLAIESQPLPGPLRGHVYQRPQLPGETFRVVLVAEGFGTSVKIPGVVRPDHTTGRIVAIFDETPQVPFTKITTRFQGGSGAPLATPPRCGTHTTAGQFTPWSGQPAVNLASSFVASWDGAGAGCPAALPFDPSVAAGSRNPVAGDTTDFVVRVQRGDRNQELRSMRVQTPPGLSAYLRGVPLCPLDRASAGTCGEGSRVGTATSGAGAGPRPYYLSGGVYLTEGYKGGQFGLSIVVPAKAGPFDLGDVVVQAALHVDRDTAQVTVVSDRLPRIVEGVPLRIRDVRVSLDREGFAKNPTSCEPMQIRTTLGGGDGAQVTRATRMQVAECAQLGFRPRLAMRLLGPRQRTTGGHPAVRALVRQRARGQSGIERVQVRLPKSLALDPDNANGLCEFEDGQRDDLENHCPRASIVGRAIARSPLLNRPVRGPVFFVKNVRIDPDTGNEIRTLPTIVIALRGEIAVNVRSNTGVRNGRLVTTFPNLPDAPINRFRLGLRGGNQGILVVTRTPRGNIDLCDRRQIAAIDMDGHNGRHFDRRTRMRTPCRRARRGAAAKRRKLAAKRRAAANRRTGGRRR